MRPLQERVALAVALLLDCFVFALTRRAAKRISDDRVVDNKIAGNLRINAARIATQSSARLAHRGEVNEHGHTGKVLEQHARGHELNFFTRATRQASLNNALGKARGLLFVFHVTQNVFNKNLQ